MEKVIDFIRNLDYAKAMIVFGLDDFIFFTGIVPAVALFLGIKKVTSPLVKDENNLMKINGKGVGFSIEKKLVIKLATLAFAVLIFSAVSLFWINFARENFPIRFG